MGLFSKISDAMGGNPMTRIKKGLIDASTGGVGTTLRVAGALGNKKSENLYNELSNTWDPKMAARDIKAYYNPEVPDMTPQGPDIEMQRQMVEEAARRRRGLADRSLLRTLMGSAVGSSGAGGKATVG